MVPINYLAVIVAAVVMFALGGLWYGKLFGKVWMEMMGMTPEQVAAFKNNPAMMQKMRISYGLQALATLVMAFVLAHALVFASSYLNVSGLAAGLQAGFWNWLGFVVPLSLGPVLWDKKPWKYFYITAGYYLVGLLMMGVILALWS